MVENKYDMKIEVQLDCTESVGYSYVPRVGKIKSVLDSGQREFVLKLIPLPRVEFQNLVRKEKIKIKIY